MEKYLDKIDLKLLKLLQKNARYSLKQLAQAVFLSSPAVSARLERLEAQGYIAGYQAMIDPLKMGYHLTAFINLKMSPEMKAAFLAFVQGCPHVVECHYVTGPYSMLLKVVFPDTTALDAFVGELQRFGTTQTQIVFSTPIAPRGLPIEDIE